MLVDVSTRYGTVVRHGFGVDLVNDTHKKREGAYYVRCSSSFSCLSIQFLYQILRFIDFAGKVGRTTAVRMVCQHDLPVGILQISPEFWAVPTLRQYGTYGVREGHT